MLISNLINQNERPVANQFIIQGRFPGLAGQVFILQSYQSKVVMFDENEQKLDFADAWEYSNTTKRAVTNFLKQVLDCEEITPADIREALETGELVTDNGDKIKVSYASNEFFEVLSVLQ